MKHSTRSKLLLKDTCLRCVYWTKDLRDGYYKCYTPTCPAYQRDKSKKHNYA